MVELGAGVWKFGAEDSLVVPDGVHLQGAGMGETILEWPTQTGAICTSRKAAHVQKGSGPNPNAGLVTSSARTRRPATQTLGWGLSDLTVDVVGGFEQNDTKVFCPAITPCLESTTCSKYTAYQGMSLQRVNISIVASTGGVDAKAGGVGMGAAVELNEGCAVQDSVVTTFGNCGSNVTPLITVSGNDTLVRNNRFNNGCTIYSMRSVVRHLWESTTSHYYGHGGRGGNVIATFGPPYRVEYVTFLNNTQTNNPTLPNSTVVKNPVTNHRLEGLTLDGGGGAYSGNVASASGTSVTLASLPFGNGTGTYIHDYNYTSWNGAAIAILDGLGAGQWRRVVGRAGPKGAEQVWEVDVAWDVTPDETSQVQIGPLRGHILLAENSWTTAYTVQLYGMCLNAVVANNVFDRTPFYVWGRNPHYWGYQPNWNVEVLGNQLPNSAGITTLSCDQKYNLCNEGANPNNGTVAYDGALNSAVAIRRNTLSNGQGIAIHGTTSDVVVEWNKVHIGTGSFMKDPVQVDAEHTDHVIVSNNYADA